METSELLRQTRALCPVCQKPLPAAYISRRSGVFLERQCPQHGLFSILVWQDQDSFLPWIGDEEPLKQDENLACPKGCGLCPDHKQATCCVLLEITKRCNLGCLHCFADPDQAPDPSFDQVKSWLEDLAEPGKTLVQLSGGEPTLRDDLPELVTAAKQAGCAYVQLNTNGLRLAEDGDFVRRLAEAGLSFVFLQFDGVDDQVYERLRGRPLFELKEKAIENCGRYNLGVTLVPTLVPGVNTGQIGGIIRYAVSKSPLVRGVHFQPVSYFGRSPVLPEEGPHFCLDQLLKAVVEQSGGLVQKESILPSCCDHPLCGFHGDYLVMPDFSLEPLTDESNPKAGTSCCEKDAAAKNRSFVSRRWSRQEPCCCGEAEECQEEQDLDLQDLDVFLDRIKSHGFTITAMVFQDAATLDIERLRKCSLHVYDRGKLVPFCAYYL